MAQSFKANNEERLKAQLHLLYMIPDNMSIVVVNDYNSCSMFNKKRQRRTSSPILICIVSLTVHICIKIQGSNLNNF